MNTSCVDADSQSWKCVTWNVSLSHQTELLANPRWKAQRCCLDLISLLCQFLVASWSLICLSLPVRHHNALSCSALIVSHHLRFADQPLSPGSFAQDRYSSFSLSLQWLRVHLPVQNTFCANLSTLYWYVQSKPV